MRRVINGFLKTRASARLFPERKKGLAVCGLMPSISTLLQGSWQAPSCKRVDIKGTRAMQSKQRLLQIAPCHRAHPKDASLIALLVVPGHQSPPQTSATNAI